MAAGDVVNTAARLQAAAPVDGILVDETTYRATRDGDRVPRGRAGRGEGQGRRRSRSGRRSAARSRFGIDVDAAATARRSSAASEELDAAPRRRSRARGASARRSSSRSSASPGSARAGSSPSSSRVVDGRPGAHLLAPGPLAALRRGRRRSGRSARWSKAQAGILETDAAEAAAEKLAAAVDALWPTRREAQLGRGAPAAARRARRRRRRRRATAATRRSPPGAASSRRSPSSAPLVLVFEDLHWADDGAARLRRPPRRLGRRRAAARRLHRAAGAARAAARLGRRQAQRGDDLALAALRRRDRRGSSPRCSSARVLPAETAGARCSRAPAATRSTPRSTCACSRDRGFLRGTARSLDAASCRCRRRCRGSSPRASTRSRPSEKALLQDAAVIGQGLLGRRARGDRRPRPRWTLEERAARRSSGRSSSGRERRSAVADETEYAFRHVLVRDVAYGQIPRARRAEKHRLGGRVDRVARRRPRRGPAPRCSRTTTWRRSSTPEPPAARPMP